MALYRYIRFGLPDSSRKERRFLLAFTWISGLFLGLLISHMADPFSDAWMRSLSYSAVSIVGLLVVTVLPFLLSAFLVFFFSPGLLYPLCFGKAFAFFLVMQSVCAYWDSAGWLVRCLLLFSDSLSCVVLYCFWLRRLDGGRAGLLSDTLMGLTAQLLIFSIDYWIIAPFWVCLIENRKG